MNSKSQYSSKVPPLPYSKQVNYQQQPLNSTNQNQIHVPQDYNTDLLPPNQLMKVNNSLFIISFLQEKFFESLGLPPDLSYESVQKFQYPNQNHHDTFKDQLPNDSRMNTLKQNQNDDDFDSQMFKSCLDGNSPLAPQSKGNTMTGQVKANTQYQTSQNSYRTALNGTNGNNGNIEKSIRSHYPPQSLSQPGTFSQHQIRENEGMSNIDMMFIDSQRKISAPTAYRQPFNLAHQDQLSQQYMSDGLADTMQRTQGQNIKELLTITVEIGNGQQENILIKENDDPYLLADSFSRKHGIGDQLRDLLAEQIRFNIEQVIEDREGGVGGQRDDYEGEMNDASRVYPQDDHQIDDRAFQQQYLAQNRSTNHNSFGNNNVFQPSTLFPPQYNLYDQPKQEKSFVQDRSSFINNQSFQTDRSRGGGGTGNKMMPNFAGAPISIKQYRQFQDQLMNKDRSHQPAINQNSKKIVETKRGSSESGRKKVHDRLHQQALSKQKASLLRQKTKGNNNDLSQLNQSQKSIRAGGSNHSTPSKIDNSQNPIGQYQMLQKLDQNLYKQRSSSQQNQRNYPPTTGQQQFNSGNMSTLSGSQLSQRPAQILNYGERLYQKGLKRKEEFERNLREAKSEQERMNNQEYSFQPHINDVSRQMNRPNNERAEDFLINYGKTVREKIEQKRSELAYQEQSECKFHPAITKKSERIMSERMGGANNNGVEYKIDKFSTLYEDARRRQERQDKIYSACMEAECTFQPDTNQTRCYNSKLENRDPNQVVFERLSSQQNTHSQMEEKGKGNYASKSNLNLNNDLFDQDTGQPYFHPKVGRGPKLQHRPSPTNGNVGSMLYEQGCFLKEKQDLKKKALQEQQKQQQNTVFTKDNTNRIMERIKLQKFAEIFKNLDSDSDGQISAQRIDISQLNPELLEVLTPLFCEMEEMGQTLNEEEFLDACGRLYDSVSLPEKNIIMQNKQALESKKQKSGYLDLPFKPQINANSQRIAAKKRPNGDVADLLIQRKQEYEMKIKEKQQEKENSELIGCTFHPKILYSPSSANSENASNRSRVYSNQRQQQQYLMLNNSQSSLQNNADYVNLPNQYKAGNKPHNDFDINNLAHNIANELLKQKSFNTAVNLKNVNNQNMMHQLHNEGHYIPPQYPQTQQQLYSGQSSNASGKTSNVNNQDILMDLSSHDSRRHLPLSQQGRWPPHYKHKLELNHNPITLMETPLSCKGPTYENQKMNWHQHQDPIATPQSNYTQLSTSVRQSTGPKKDEDNASRGGGGGMSKIFSEKGNSCQLNLSQDMGVVKQMDGGGGWGTDYSHELVMSRSDWFSCLKVAYAQLETTIEGVRRDKVNGVDKDQLIAMIEINLNQLPLQSLKDYIGQSVVRKEKWISYGHVIESLKKIETQSNFKNGSEENVVFWDEIIDSLLSATLHNNNNNRSLVIDSNNISEIYSSEAAFSIGAAVNTKNQNLQQISKINIEIGKAQKKEQELQSRDNKKEVLKQGKKLILKDGSILLDLSKIEQAQANQSVQEVLQLFVNKDQQHNLRGMSLACMSFNQPVSHYLNISNMNGLVILNLSSMGNSIDLEQELTRINLLNLQFLNLSNNSLSKINFTNHNFPKLKEIYANNNKFSTAKSFAKLDSIKLLDLEDNLIEDYEELVCLAFLQNMIVLSLRGNPVSGFQGFEGNMKKILSKLTLLNPDNIKKVSCFENFKELAFSNGLKPNSKSSSHQNSDSQLSQYNDVPKRTVNISLEKDALVQKYTIAAPLQITASQRSTPNKQTVYNVQTKRFFLKKDDSPLPAQSSNKSPQKITISSKMLINPSLQNDTYESQNIHNKLICPQALPIKNDSLKYFNKLSKKGDEESNRQSKEVLSSYNVSLETESEQQSKHPLVSQSTYDKKDDLSSSKPPRCIKIRPSPSIPTMSSQNQIMHLRGVVRGTSNTSQTIAMDSSTITETEIGLQTPKYNRRDIHSQHIQPFAPLQNQNIDEEQMNRRGIPDNHQGKSEVARYYERSISQMNINKIREMASKEVCKVSDNQIKGNMSPINAMMILQPPQVVESNENRQSISVSKGEKGFGQQTPKQGQKRYNSNQKSNSTVRRRNGSKKITPTSQNDFIRNENQSRHNQNKTQTFSFNKVISTKHGHPPATRSNQGLLKSSRNRKLNPSALSIDNKYAKGMSYEGHTMRSSIDENSSFLKPEAKFNNVNRTQHPITNRDGQFSTPFQNYINNIADMTSKESERDSIRPFRLPPRESPSLYKKHHIDKENQQHLKKDLNYSQEDRMNQLRTTEKKEYTVSASKHRMYQVDEDDYVHDENINTPRFSDRIKEQNKEHKYQVAMKKINSKRQQKEDKKQLYNSIKGQHRQSLSSTTSNKAIEQKGTGGTGRDSSSSMRYNQGSKTHILNENCSRVSSSNCLKLNIDLRKNR